MFYMPKKAKGKNSWAARKKFLKAARREARHIFSKLKDSYAGTTYPATGTLDSA